MMTWPAYQEGLPAASRKLVRKKPEACVTVWVWVTAGRA